jgi:hypothetical protein
MEGENYNNIHVLSKIEGDLDGWSVGGFGGIDEVVPHISRPFSDKLCCIFLVHLAMPFPLSILYFPIVSIV